MTYSNKTKVFSFHRQLIRRKSQQTTHKNTEDTTTYLRVLAVTEGKSSCSSEFACSG